MRFTIQSYLILILLVLTIISVNLTATATVCYAIFCLFTFFYLKSLPAHSAHQSIGVIIVGSFLLSYFLRPFLLYADMDIFSYGKQIAISVEDMDNAITDNLIGCVVMCLGFLLTVAVGEKIFRPAPIKPGQFLIIHKNSILTLIIFLVLLYAFLLFGLGIGYKGEKINSPLAFLSRLIPYDLIFSVIFMYFAIYYKELSLLQIFLLLAAFFLVATTILATGSKSFVSVLGFAFGTWLISNKKQIPVTLFILLVFGGFVILSLSFVLATSVKISNKLGLNLNALLSLVWDALLHTPVKEYMEDITSRFIGFDGTVAVNKVYATWYTNYVDQLEAAFSFREIIYKTLGGLVPNLKLSSTVNTGVAVGRYIEKLPPEFIYAGAVGIVGSSKIMSFTFYKLILFFSGAVIGLYSLICSRVRDADLSFILTFFMSYSTLFYVMSGNLDLILTLFITKIALLFLYKFIAQLLSSLFTLMTQMSVKPIN